MKEMSIRWLGPGGLLTWHCISVARLENGGGRMEGWWLESSHMYIVVDQIKGKVSTRQTWKCDSAKD